MTIPPHKILHEEFSHDERGVIWATLQVSLGGEIVEVNGESSVSEKDAAHAAIRHLSIKAEQLRRRRHTTDPNKTMREVTENDTHHHDCLAVEEYERGRPE